VLWNVTSEGVRKIYSFGVTHIEDISDGIKWNEEKWRGKKIREKWFMLKSKVTWSSKYIFFLRKDAVNRLCKSIRKVLPNKVASQTAGEESTVYMIGCLAQYKNSTVWTYTWWKWMQCGRTHYEFAKYQTNMLISPLKNVTRPINMLSPLKHGVWKQLTFRVFCAVL
jgi:hypothetical protein